MLPSVSVSNLDLFRFWKDEEDLDLEWLVARLRGEEETESMRVGSAFHAALENLKVETETLVHGVYRFDINCDCEIAASMVRELPVEALYGKLLVRGRVDSVCASEVVDYKTTERFDADRFMGGYQWRFYLDMLGMDSFCWKVFVLREFGDAGCYEVKDFHVLRQKRYPGMHDDCCRLAEEYHRFSVEHLREVSKQREQNLVF